MALNCAQTILSPDHLSQILEIQVLLSVQKGPILLGPRRQLRWTQVEGPTRILERAFDVSEHTVLDTYGAYRHLLMDESGTQRRCWWPTLHTADTSHRYGLRVSILQQRTSDPRLVLAVDETGV